VFQTTLHADENTDPEIALGQLRARCEAAGVAAPAIEMLTAQLSDILTPLVLNGKRLAAQGSQLSVTRDIGDEGHKVRLVFGSGVPRSGWRKFLDRLRGS
jgi:hypothetical protein